MSLLNCFRAQHDIIHDVRTLPAVEGLNLIFSHFDGYSPPLDGSIRTTTSESSSSETDGKIAVTINVRGSNPSCTASTPAPQSSTDPSQVRTTSASAKKTTIYSLQLEGSHCSHMPQQHVSSLMSLLLYHAAASVTYRSNPTASQSSSKKPREQTTS